MKYWLWWKEKGDWEFRKEKFEYLSELQNKYHTLYPFIIDYKFFREFFNGEMQQLK